MKKIVYISISLLCCLCSLRMQSAETIPIEKSTNLVFRRYYFIARLEKTILLLREIINSTPQENITRIANCSEMPPFSHSLILEATYRIQQTKSLTPIIAVWEDFSAYKSLEAEIVIEKDDLFVKEFSQQLFFITKNILLTSRPAIYKNMFYNFNDIINGSSEQVLDYLDYIVELIEHDPVTTEEHSITQQRVHSDIKVHASSDEVNNRFYLIKRLSNAIDIITMLNTKSPHIIKSPENITKLKSDWSQIKQYRKIGDQEYVYNFCVLLFKVFRGMNQQTSQGNSTSMFENLDLEDIICSIDIISDELQTVFNDYQSKETTSFKEWLFKNWWVPIYTLGSTALRLLNYHYTGEKSKETT